MNLVIRPAGMTDRPPYRHLLPLVEFLLDAGMAPDPLGFHSTQGGWNYTTPTPIPFHALDSGITLPPSTHLMPDDDRIFDESSWSSITGTGHNPARQNETHRHTTPNNPLSGADQDTYYLAWRTNEPSGQIHTCSNLRLLDTHGLRPRVEATIDPALTSPIPGDADITRIVLTPEFSDNTILPTNHYPGFVMLQTPDTHDPSRRIILGHGELHRTPDDARYHRMG